MIIQIDEIKPESLKRIASLYNVKNFSNIYLVDDLPCHLQKVKQAGFSTISAENVCVPDKEQRDKNAIELINKIESEISKRILSIKKPSIPFFFTQIPEFSPLQESLLTGFEQEKYLGI